jgi:hypothetical protein
MDKAIGFIIIGLGILGVLSTVFIVTLRVGSRQATRPTPPHGVHVPLPSWLPVIIAVGCGLLGAGLAFRPDGWPVEPILGVLGLLTLATGIVLWVRAAGHEWRETEGGPDHASGGH